MRTFVKLFDALDEVVKVRGRFALHRSGVAAASWTSDRGFAIRSRSLQGLSLRVSMDSRSVGNGTSVSGGQASRRIGSVKTMCGGAAFLLASAYMLRRTMLTIAPPGSNDGGTLADGRPFPLNRSLA